MHALSSYNAQSIQHAVHHQYECTQIIGHYGNRKHSCCAYFVELEKHFGIIQKHLRSVKSPSCSYLIYFFKILAYFTTQQYTWLHLLNFGSIMNKV